MELSKEQLEALLAQIELHLGQLWNQLTPAQRQALEKLYAAIKEAIDKARQLGPAAARITLVALAERLQAFLAALAAQTENVLMRGRLRWLVHLIFRHLAALGPASGGTVIAGPVVITGITAGTVAALLIELAAVSYALYMWWMFWEEWADTTPEPYGGKPCGSPLPVAQGIKLWDVSYGKVRSWENLMKQAQEKAATYPCPGACATGKCTGSPAVMDFGQNGFLVGTYSWCIIDVYCECL